MEKDEIKIRNIFQTTIDKEFNKFEEFRFDEKTFKIAVRKDEVPVIEYLDIIDDNIVLIYFSKKFPIEVKHEKHDDFRVVRDDDGSIKVAILILDKSKYTSDRYLQSFNEKVLTTLKSHEEPQTYREAVKLHIQERIGKAINKIIKTILQQNTIIFGH